MERSLMIPMNLKNTDPILNQTNETLLTESQDLNAQRSHLDNNFISRKNNSGLYSHFVDVSEQNKIVTNIENIINENANLNDINNHMREKNLEYSSYKNTMAEVDDSLAIVRDENLRVSQMNILLDDKNCELKNNLKPFEGRKLPRKVR